MNLLIRLCERISPGSHERHIRDRLADEIAAAHGPLDPHGDDGDHDRGVLAAIRTVRHGASGGTR